MEPRSTALVMGCCPDPLARIVRGVEAERHCDDIRLPKLLRLGVAMLAKQTWEGWFDTTGHVVKTATLVPTNVLIMVGPSP